MELWILATAIGCTVLVALLFSTLFVKRYLDPRDSTCGITFSCIMALTISLFCLFVIPVDIYSVSSGLLYNGWQGNPGLVSDVGEALRWIYYGLYIILCVYAFLILPFYYFYFQEDMGNDDTRAQTIGALKYTGGFLFTFIVLLCCGILLKTDYSDSSDSVVAKLAEGFLVGDSILFFVVGTLVLIGLVAFMFYGAYGMAVLPAFLWQQIDNSAYVKLTRTQQGGDDDVKIKRAQDRIRFLESKYNMSAREWDKRDKEEHKKHKKEIRRINAVKRRHQEIGVGGSDVVSLNSDFSSYSNSCPDKCWNCLSPFRMIIGAIFFLLSWFIIVSMILASIDRILNSECGASCGYLLEKATVVNPADEALRMLQDFFPFDYVVFTIIMLYMFFCALFGITEKGVKFLYLHMYDMNASHTPPHAMLMAVWLVCFMVLSLSFQAYALMPYYFTYGDQFFINGTNTVHSQCNVLAGRDNQCVLTQVGSFVLTQTSQLPFFGVAMFYINLAFLGLFLIFSVYAACICRSNRRSSVEHRNNLV